jgi:hypothetical protein
VSSNPKDSYPDEQSTLSKPPEMTLSKEMIIAILVFLDTSPLAIFAGESPQNGTEWSESFENIFKFIIRYLITDDDRIRHLANTFVRKVLTDSTAALWQKSQSFGLTTFKSRFWQST